MKRLSIIIAVCLFALFMWKRASTRPHLLSTSTDAREINTILLTHLPEEQAKVVSKNLDGTRHILTLSEEEFSRLQHAFCNDLEQICKDNHNYDAFGHRATTYDSDFAMFTKSGGIGDRYEFIIFSTRTTKLSDKGNVIIEIKFTQT